MVEIRTLKNGLTLIIEEMPHFESVSYDLHIPGGIITDSEDEIGNALLLAELGERGAGGMDSRQLSDAYDMIGARHSLSAGTDRYAYRGTVLSDTLEKALELLSLQVLAPVLPEEEIDSIKELLMMDLKSLPDNPSRMTMIELTRRFLPSPYNRPSIATEEGLQKINLQSLKKSWQSFFKPEGSILSVAGNCTVEQVVKIAEKLFGQWSGKSPALPPFGKLPSKSSHHVKQETAQVQICLAYRSVKFGEPLYYAAKVANEVLSGGMFGRLFIEVREKRGLCYSVHSRHSSGKHIGSVTAYAGTTPERAHETLTVMREVLKGLKGTIDHAELARAKANLKAALIIGEESPGSRASSNAGDYWLASRVRTLEEISSAIDAVQTVEIDRYIEEYSPDEYSLVTLGAQSIF